MLEEIERGGLDANVSVKLTGLGLKLSYDLCRANLETVVRDAAGRGRFVRIDMEDSSTTDDTLHPTAAFARTGTTTSGSYSRPRCGVSSTTSRRWPTCVRGCASARASTWSPSRSRSGDFDAVRANFVASTHFSGSVPLLAIATHDDYLVDEGRRAVERHGLAPSDYEFQILLGVRPQLGDRLVEEGRRLRIYVPFGRYWYEYSLRRLKENPRIAGYIAADTLGRLVPGRG